MLGSLPNFLISNFLFYFKNIVYRILIKLIYHYNVIYIFYIIKKVVINISINILCYEKKK